MVAQNQAAHAFPAPYDHQQTTAHPIASPEGAVKQRGRSSIVSAVRTRHETKSARRHF